MTLSRTAFLLCAFLVGNVGLPRAQNPDPDLPRLLELYRHLHAHPELSGQEQQTAARVAEELRQLGFEVTEGVGRYHRAGLKPYGVVGVLKNGDGPVVMIRTDLDALPVEEKTGLPFASQAKGTSLTGENVSIMHACGHDLHMTCFLGTARRMSDSRSSWQGTLVMIGQPSEEIGAGAKAMLEDGLYSRFPKPDFVLALHDSAVIESGKIGVRSEFILAGVDSVDVVIRGKGGHGAWPHMTKDPVVMAAEFIVAIQTIVSREIAPTDPAVVTVGSIHGGTKYNIIPDEVKLQLTIRYYKEEVHQQILAALKRIGDGIAHAAGVPDDLLPTVKSGEETNPATYNDPKLTERLREVWKRELGEARVVEADPVMGAEDFSYFREGGIPTCLFWLGSVSPARMADRTSRRTPLPSLHSSQFAPDVERAIPTGIQAMTAAALELFKGKKTTSSTLR